MVGCLAANRRALEQQLRAFIFFHKHKIELIGNGVHFWNLRPPPITLNSSQALGPTGSQPLKYTSLWRPFSFQLPYLVSAAQSGSLSSGGLHAREAEHPTAAQSMRLGALANPVWHGWCRELLKSHRSSAQVVKPNYPGFQHQQRLAEWQQQRVGSTHRQRWRQQAKASLFSLGILFCWRGLLSQLILPGIWRPTKRHYLLVHITPNQADSPKLNHPRRKCEITAFPQKQPETLVQKIFPTKEVTKEIFQEDGKW